MKLNNKGFAITLVLYGTLVLFLLLIVSMLGILSTYKLRLEKLYPEPDVEEKQLTCELTAKYGSDGYTSITINVNDESLLHETPYSYLGSWTTKNPYYNQYRTNYNNVMVRDKKGNQVNCGKVYFYSVDKTKYIYTADTWYCCDGPKTDDLLSQTVCRTAMLGDSNKTFDTAAAAIAECKSGCIFGPKFVYGCESKAITEKKWYIATEKPK